MKIAIRQTGAEIKSVKFDGRRIRTVWLRHRKTGGMTVWRVTQLDRDSDGRVRRTLYVGESEEAARAVFADAAR